MTAVSDVVTSCVNSYNAVWYGESEQIHTGRKTGISAHMKESNSTQVCTAETETLAVMSLGTV
jgi:hypothetical protein